MTEIGIFCHFSRLFKQKLNTKFTKTFGGLVQQFSSFLKTCLNLSFLKQYVNPSTAYFLLTHRGSQVPTPGCGPVYRDGGQKVVNQLLKQFFKKSKKLLKNYFLRNHINMLNLKNNFLHIFRKN